MSKTTVRNSNYFQITTRGRYLMAKASLRQVGRRYTRRAAGWLQTGKTHEVFRFGRKRATVGSSLLWKIIQHYGIRNIYNFLFKVQSKGDDRTCQPDHLIDGNIICSLKKKKKAFTFQFWARMYWFANSPNSCPIKAETKPYQPCHKLLLFLKNKLPEAHLLGSRLPPMWMKRTVAKEKTVSLNVTS